MPEIPKVPLNKRLQQASDCRANFLAAFELFAEDYFEGMVQITGESDFMDRYQKEIRKHYYEGKGDYFLAELSVLADNLTGKDGIWLLYRVFIEPFAAITEQERKEQT